MIEKNYDSKFDIIKFILSLFVVLVHTEVYTKALHPWIKITVPMFFVITSYFLFSKLNRSKSIKDKNSQKSKYVTAPV